MCANDSNAQLLNQLEQGYHTVSPTFQSHRKYAYVDQLTSRSAEGGLIILIVTS